MRFKKIFDGLYCVKFKDAYSCLGTMIRIQEFYEAVSKKIRGKYFTFEELMDHYAKVHGNFTYFTDWGGFNIKGNVLIKFFDVFDKANDLTNKEADLYNYLSDRIPEWNTGEDFYVIAVYDDWYLNHEIAHGLWYLSPSYQREMRKHIRFMNTKDKTRVREKLKEWGYGRSYISDEIQAYMSTSSYKEIRKEFGIIEPGDICSNFRKTFKKYFKEAKKNANKSSKEPCYN